MERFGSRSESGSRLKEVVLMCSLLFSSSILQPADALRE